MYEVELAAGTIEYEDTGGTGPVVVPLHGLLMNGSLWREVVADLRTEFRCVVPTLPLGAHRLPMRPDADLSGAGLARLVAEFLDRLDLRDVTLVGCDWGGAQLVVARGLGERVGRLVLVSQEAFDNVPPGLPGRTVARAARLPGGLAAAVYPLRVRALRRTPLAFGWMSKRPVPDEIMEGWLRPARTDRRIRADLLRYLRAAPDDYPAAARRLAAFRGPALVVWAAEDRVMPPAHGRRLAAYLRARLIEVPDSYTLVPIDRPEVLSGAIRDLLRRSGAHRRASAPGSASRAGH